MASLMAFVLTAFMVFVSSEAKTFLRTNPVHPGVSSLLGELEAMLGTKAREDLEARANRMEELMRPTFNAMPKSANGGVGEEAVRYMLHRVFVARHGWFVRGLASAGESGDNSLSPTEALREGMVDGVPDLFDAHLSADGLTLHHAAVLAATLESLVHKEAAGRLVSAYRLAGASVDDSVSADVVRDIIDRHMLINLADVSDNHTELSSETMEWMMEVMHTSYPHWEETRAWTRSIQQEVLPDDESHDGSSAKFSFNDTLRLMEVIGDRYGSWQNRECVDIKDALAKLDDTKTGRVRLDRFYGAALDGEWHFSESVPYMRSVGVLEESGSGLQQPHVIIPNYISSPSNCVATSKFYATCCTDECEPLLAHLESHIAAPEASPERILELVANIATRTVAAPRELPPNLAARLDEIAAQHGSGMVPLHGRLFAQWLHHAFPLECRYPHPSGTAQQVSTRAWMQQTGEHVLAETGAMQRHVEQLQTMYAHNNNSDTSEEEMLPPVLPWSEHEESFVSSSRRKQKRRSSSLATSLLQLFAVVGVVLSMVVALGQGLTQAAASSTSVFHGMQLGFGLGGGRAMKLPKYVD